MNCPNCGAQAPAGASFCDNCGAPLAGAPARPETGRGASQPAGTGASGGLRCPTCGESVLAGEMYCGNCGASLAGLSAAGAAPAPWEQSSPSWPSVPPTPRPAPPTAVAPAAWEQSQPSWPSGEQAMPPQAPPPPIQRAVDSCPNCGSAVQPNDTFCDNCGQQLTPKSGFPGGQQIPAEPFASQGGPALPPPQPPVATAINPRLVLQGGATVNLPTGKQVYLIGREDPVSGSFPDVDLVPYGGEEGGVSRRHAQIGRRGDQFSVEDLNSVNYTFVNRQKIAPGVAHPLKDGDEIRLGRVVMTFKLM